MVAENDPIEKETDGTIISHAGRMFTDPSQCHVSQNNEKQHLMGQPTEVAVKAKYGSTIPKRLVRATILFNAKK